MVTASADGTSLRRSRRLIEEEEAANTLSEQKTSRNLEESYESDGDPDFNHKDFEWLYKLPGKPKPKVYVECGIHDKGTPKKAGGFQLKLPSKHKKRLLDSPRDFQLPPNIWRPLYPLTTVNGWKTLTRNIWTKEALAIYENIAEKIPECVCEEDCDEDCLNRVSRIECDNDNCPFIYCTNRAFQLQAQLPAPYVPTKNREYAGGRVLYSRGYEVFATGPKGFGLRATREYQPHELILEYTGEVITNDEMAHRMSTIYAHTRKYYCLSFVNGLVIDSGIKGSEARYVNHSCRPNCEMQKWYVKGDPRIGLFAGDEPIPAGTELAYDYNFDIFKGAIGQKCFCGEKGCRGIIGKRFPKGSKRKAKCRSDLAQTLSREQKASPKESAETLKIRFSLKGAAPSAPQSKKRASRSSPYKPNASNGYRESKRLRRTTLSSSQASQAPQSVSSLNMATGPSTAEKRAERARLRATLEPISPKNMPRMRATRKDRLRATLEPVSVTRKAGAPKKATLVDQQEAQSQRHQQEELAERQADATTTLNVGSLLTLAKDIPSPDSSVSSGFHTFEEEADMPSSHTSAQESDVEIAELSNGRTRNQKRSAPSKKDESEDSSVENAQDRNKNAGGRDKSDGSASAHGGQDGRDHEEDDEDADKEESDNDDEEEEEESESESDSEPSEEQEFFPSKAARRISTPTQRQRNNGKGRPSSTVNNHPRQSNPSPQPENPNSRNLRHRRRVGEANEIDELQELPVTKRHRRKKNETFEHDEPNGDSSELERQQFLEDNMSASKKLKQTVVPDSASSNTNGVSPKIPGPVEPIGDGKTAKSGDVPANPIPKPVPSVMAFNRTSYINRHFGLGDRLAEAVAGKETPEKPAIVNSVATAPSPPDESEQTEEQSKPQAQAQNTVQPIAIGSETIARYRTRANTRNPNGRRPTNILTAAEVAATFSRTQSIPIRKTTTVPARMAPTGSTPSRRQSSSPRNSQRMEVRLPANNNPPSSVPANALNQIQHAQSQQQPQKAQQQQSQQQPQQQQQQQPGMMVHPQFPYMFMNSLQMGGQMVTIPQFPMQFGQMGIQQQMVVQTPQGNMMMMQPPMMLMPQTDQRSVKTPMPQQMMYTSPQAQHPQPMYAAASTPMTPYLGAQAQPYVQGSNPGSQPHTPLMLPYGQQVVFQSSPVPASLEQSPAVNSSQSGHNTPESQGQTTPAAGASAHQAVEAPAAGTNGAQGEAPPPEVVSADATAPETPQKTL